MNMDTFGFIFIVLTIISRVDPAETTSRPTAVPTRKPTTPDSTQPPTAGEGTSSLTFSLRRTFESSMSDPTSTAYQSLAKEVTREVNKGYRAIFPLTYSRCVIRSFSNGSIRVAMSMVYHNKTVVPTGMLVEEALRDVIISGIIDLNVNVSTISTTTNTSGGPTLKMTITTAFCLPFLLTVFKGMLSST
ncbi:unnamed protein product [Gadus morhua 'NCC']